MALMKEKEITITDLAQKLGISIATVSRAFTDSPRINKKTKKKILDLAEELGYRSNSFARNLRENKPGNTIGVIVPRLDSSFMSSVIAGIEQVVNKKGYQLIISQSAENFETEKQNVQAMYNGRVDGLLISISNETENTDHLKQFFKKKIPVIFFDRVVKDPPSVSVLIDNHHAAYQATRHLIDNGCKHLVHITTESKIGVYQERLEGFKKALADSRLPFADNQILYCNLTREEGTDLAEKISKMQPRPDGVFVSGDVCAVGCMLAFRKMGINVPQDIAFVGFNNDPVSTVVDPNLTTVNYPGFDVGMATASSLIMQMEGTTNIVTSNTIMLRSELIIRESSVRTRS